MKKQWVAWVCVMVTASAAALAGQVVTVATVDDHDTAMKAISSNARAVPALLEASALGDVKDRYVVIREQFVGVEGFWAARETDDAAMLARNAIERVDAIIEAVEASDRAAIDVGIQRLVAACAACHTKYREADPTTPRAFVHQAWRSLTPLSHPPSGEKSSQEPFARCVKAFLCIRHCQ